MIQARRAGDTAPLRGILARREEVEEEDNARRDCIKKKKKTAKKKKTQKERRRKTREEEKHNTIKLSKLRKPVFQRGIAGHVKITEGACPESRETIIFHT